MLWGTAVFYFLNAISKLGKSTTKKEGTYIKVFTSHHRASTDFVAKAVFVQILLALVAGVDGLVAGSTLSAACAHAGPF